MMRHLNECRPLGLACLMFTAVACDAKTSPDASSTATSSTAASSAAGQADATQPKFPPYPSATSAGGVLWLQASGGPLGETTFRALPQEQNVAADGIYAQSAAEKRRGEPVVYTLNLGGKKPGVHPLKGAAMKFYVGDGTGTNDRYFHVIGKIRIDENDPATGRFKAVVVGDAKADKTGKSSPIVAALVLRK